MAFTIWLICLIRTPFSRIFLSIQAAFTTLAGEGRNASVLTMVLNSGRLLLNRSSVLLTSVASLAYFPDGVSAWDVSTSMALSVTE